MDSIKASYKNLTQLWKAQPKDLAKIRTVVDNLKVEFACAGFLPVTEADKDQSESMAMQRDVLEIGALLSILQSDIPAFERGMAQLNHYYTELKKPVANGKVPRSEMELQMKGLDLLCLLAQNKLPEFHMALQRIPLEDREKSPYIDAPVKLEQYLSQGVYNKIFLMRGSMPCSYCDLFMEILLETVRDEIGNCMEKAYPQMAIKDSAGYLFIEGADAEKKAVAYGNKRGWKKSSDGKSWQFKEGARQIGEENQGVDAKELAQRNIFYAKQLEMIV